MFIKKQKHHRKSKLGCLGYHEAPEEAEIAVVPSLPPRKDVKPIEAENEQSKQAFSLVLATAVAAGAAVAAAAEVARLTNVSRYPGKTREEIAAIKIQTVFRGYLVWTCYPSIFVIIRFWNMRGLPYSTLLQAIARTHKFLIFNK